MVLEVRGADVSKSPGLSASASLRSLTYGQGPRVLELFFLKTTLHF